MLPAHKGEYSDREFDLRHEDAMALKICAAGLCAAVIAAMALASAPAEAAAKKRTVSKPPVTRQVAPRQVAVNRARTRITVQPRSFLDPGREILPGEYKYNDYAFPPGYSPTSVIDNKAGHHRSPLPGPFDLPGWGW
jgi:hypothetical protein